MNFELNIDIDSKIDPDNLDQEWKQQPHLFHLYAVEHAKRIKEKRETDNRLRREIIDNWDGPKAISESTLTNEVKSHPDMVEAEYQENIWSSYVKAMEMKKAAMENLVKLGTMDYFSIPTASGRQLNREWSKQIEEERVRDKIRDGLNEGRKKSIRGR